MNSSPQAAAKGCQSGVINWIMYIILAVCTVFLFFACKLTRDFTIPSEPTIWVVSEIYEDTKNPFPNRLVGYKMIPVNPGSINAKPTWKVDFKGKYYVGQRVDFQPIPQDAARSLK